MLRCVLVFWSIAPMAWSQIPAPIKDVRDALSRAQMMYRGARFEETINLLQPLAESLRSQPDLRQERVNAEVYLGLAHIAMGATANAKSHFSQVLVLDPGYALDPQIFSSAGMKLFEETRAEAAESAYAQALEAYEKDHWNEALGKFQTALKLQPQHRLASQYLALTRNKLTLEIVDIFLQWRERIEAGDYVLAAADYKRIESMNLVENAAGTLDEMRSEYRRILSSLVESWKDACRSRKVAAMDTLWKQAMMLLPDRAIAEDILKQMTCEQRGCVRLEGAVAMSRLVSRIEPTIPAALARVASRPVAVYVQAVIHENGDVTVIETQGFNPGIREAVRLAVEDWKFSPTVVDGETRCVDTILAIQVRR